MNSFKRVLCILFNPRLSVIYSNNEKSSRYYSAHESFYLLDEVKGTFVPKMAMVEDGLLKGMTIV
jgi:hypothetical protein